MPTRRALVIGCGVFGVTTARELARRRWAVTLVEPGPIPRPEASSTDRSKIVRMDYGSDLFLTRLAEEALDGWRCWNQDLFTRPLFHEVGFLLLSRGPLAAGGFEYESMQAVAGLGHPVRRLDRAAIRREHPAWNADAFVDGYLSLHAGWVESGQAVSELAAAARAEGVDIRKGRAETIVADTVDGAGVQLRGGGFVQAEAIVVAAGAWTPQLVPALAGALRPVALPVLLLRPGSADELRPPRLPVWSADITGTGWYGFPAGEDGIVKIGHHGRGWPGRPEHPGPVPAEWEARGRRFLRDAIPRLADAPLAGTRACHYCDSTDGDFWIARDPHRPALVVASGGSGHGFKFAPLLGGLVADAVEGVENPRLERFRWRPEAPPAREHARYQAQ